MVLVTCKFFFSRREAKLDFGAGDNDAPAGLVDYPNLPRAIGLVLSTGKATLDELATVYSLEDVYLMAEVAMVDAHNRRMIAKHDAAKREGR